MLLVVLREKGMGRRGARGRVWRLGRGGGGGGDVYVFEGGAGVDVVDWG